jgi:hypothetical protein
VMWPQAERRRVQSGYVTVLPPVAVGAGAPGPTPVGAYAPASVQAG